MTFIHFINCASLALLPPMVIYKSSRLSKYESYSTVVRAAVFYVITQFAKMIIAASIVPASEDEEYEFDIIQEIMKAAISCLDVYGMKYLIEKARLDNEVKHFAVGLGWAAADALATKVGPIYYGARSMQFDWAYLALAVEANINIVTYIALARFVWLSTRITFDKAYTTELNVGLYGACLVPFVVRYESSVSFAIQSVNFFPAVN
eukprot:TRINITY_DN1062_c0_g1_i4.p1 TRINITY_DN1062_c0_g1~~TRINITY_DN1062_c0_g1_i4.p1  ORF type:complete len:206 (-),score=43.59 TRINITY_DN1062_c0_g1_i4:122-739(-)